MLRQHLQFRPYEKAISWVAIRRQQLLGVRVTPYSLEFPYFLPNGEFAVQEVRGNNLACLIPRLLNGDLSILEPGFPIPTKPFIEIVSIRQTRELSPFNNKLILAPERNTVPKNLLCIDSCADRYYFGFDNIEAYGPKSSGEEKLLLQFRGPFSFVLTPMKGDFRTLATSIRDSNLNVGSCNKISPFADQYYVHGGDANRYFVSGVDWKRDDLASKGEWTITHDRRPDLRTLTPAQAEKLGLPMKPKRPAVEHSL